MEKTKKSRSVLRSVPEVILAKGLDLGKALDSIEYPNKLSRTWDDFGYKFNSRNFLAFFEGSSQSPTISVAFWNRFQSQHLPKIPLQFDAFFSKPIKVSALRFVESQRSKLG